MIEDFHLKEDYFYLSEQLYNNVQKFINGKKKSVIGFCGESGSGKSITSFCFSKFLERKNIKNLILHQDSYYFFPPKTNQENRKETLENIGLNEINFALMQNNIDTYLSCNPEIDIPIVDYKKNNFFTRKVKHLSSYKILIAEGSFVFNLQNIDRLFFLDRTYKDTLPDRKNRTREKYDSFVEKVLEIEHQIIAKEKNKSRWLINSQYQLIDQNINF